MSERPGDGRIRKDVVGMLQRPGVYICGDRDTPEATVVIVSNKGRLVSIRLDQELDPRGFLPGFYVSSGPHVAKEPA